MTGTSTAKALWEASCKCVPDDTQVWTLENSLGTVYFPGTPTVNYAVFGGLSLLECATPSTTMECTTQTFETSGTANSAINVLSVCGGNLPSLNGGSLIVDCSDTAFRNYDCKKRCWTDHIIENIAGTNETLGGNFQNINPISKTYPGPVNRPCRLYLTAGSWTPTAVASVPESGDQDFNSYYPQPNVQPVSGGISTVRVEILKALDAVINCFVSCSTYCPAEGDSAALIPDTLVDTSILAYAFNQGGFCGNYFDSNGDPIQSAAQFVSAVLGGEDILFDCSSPINTAACGCLCASQSAITINLCNFPCLATRLICTEKLKNVLANYIQCHRRRRGCGFCITGTV